jgi:hypothetical protein
VEQLRQQRELAELDLGDRDQPLLVALGDLAGLDAVEADDEVTDGRGIPGGDPEVLGLTGADGLVPQGEHADLVEGHPGNGHSRVPEPRPRRHAHRTGHPHELSAGPGQRRPARADPHIHRHGRGGDLVQQVGVEVGADHHARAVDLEHEGPGPLGLDRGHRPRHGIDHHRVEQTAHLQDGDEPSARAAGRAVGRTATRLIARHRGARGLGTSRRSGADEETRAQRGQGGHHEGGADGRARPGPKTGSSTRAG